jgi:hypothetical protein
VDVTAVQDAPTAANNTVTTNEDTTYTFTAANFNFADVDGDSLSHVQVTSLESAGSLQYNGSDVALNEVITKADIDAGLLTFTPAANANGAGYDSFQFKVHDGTEYSAAAYSMTVDVTAVQDAPTAANNTVTTNEDTTYTFTAADFNFADVEGDSLTQVQVTSLESAGSLQCNGSDVTLNQVIAKADIDAGLLTFAPAANANGAGYDSFQFKVHDGTEYSAAAYQMTVDVTAVQDAPTAANNTVTTNEDTTYTFAAADFNFVDVDGDPVSQVQITALESVGSLQLSGVDITLDQVISKADIDAGNLKFIPVADENGAGYDSFQFKVHDGTEYSAAAYQMTVDVTAVDDTPPAVTGGDTTTDPDNDDSPADVEGEEVLEDEEGGEDLDSGLGDEGDDTSDDLTDQVEVPGLSTETASSTTPQGASGSMPAAAPGPHHPKSTRWQPDVPKADATGLDASKLDTPSTEASEAVDGPGPDETASDSEDREATISLTADTVLTNKKVWQAVDSAKAEMRGFSSSEKTMEKSLGVFTVGTMKGLTAVATGCVTWALRGLSLLASFMTTLPLWRSFDPLPILDAEEKKRHDLASQEGQGEQDADKYEEQVQALFDSDDTPQEKPDKRTQS